MGNTIVGLTISPHEGEVSQQLLRVLVLKTLSFHFHVSESYWFGHSILVIRQLFESWHVLENVEFVFKFNFINEGLEDRVELGITLALPSALTLLLRSVVLIVILQTTRTS